MSRKKQSPGTAIELDGSSLTLEDVVAVSRRGRPVALAEGARAGIAASRKVVEQISAGDKAVYGINTGVGELAGTIIPAEDIETLQLNLIRSHAVGVGMSLSPEASRAVMVLRANALAKGHSGVRIELIELLCELLNRQVTPLIPSQGSVGASGDLAPLAHLALVLIGEGECIADDQPVPAAEALARAKLAPITLAAKEGLALINGTQIMAGLGCLLADRARRLVKAAQIAGAMSVEALHGTDAVFDPRIHATRPHPGQIRCANNMRRLIAGSDAIASHADCEKIQDAYTLRCIPQVYGAAMDTVEYVAGVLAVEINSATDNPLVFADTGDVISCGNFHGEPLAFAMDFLGIALAEIANIVERTIDRLVNPHLSGLPPFLVAKSGLNSGFMICQYTAASLVSENKVLAHPASVDSIPTSAGQEDHVSMGVTSALHARQIIRNVENVLAIELLCAAQGMDFCDGRAAKGTAAAHAAIRQHVAHLDDDRALYQDIETARRLVVDGVIFAAVEDAVGSLD
ncbi:MAG: histidine ammonia-lyase [Planctomycetota bacterium]|jgi:histidine ammonia-lyase